MYSRLTYRYIDLDREWSIVLAICMTGMWFTGWPSSCCAEKFCFLLPTQTPVHSKLLRAPCPNNIAVQFPPGHHPRLYLQNPLSSKEKWAWQSMYTTSLKMSLRRGWKLHWWSRMRWRYLTDQKVLQLLKVCRKLMIAHLGLKNKL